MNVPFLDSLTSLADLRAVAVERLPEIAQDLRDRIIKIVAANEGHLGASLGVVDLTVALHYVFDTPNDRLIWDVGHQAYGHKMLTGRLAQFHTNRKLGGISGFPKRSESEFDAFGTGHSSTAISAALGMALAAQQQKKFSRQHIAVIGDASIAAGMAFEALNHAGETNANLLIVLNDNSIGIDPSVGALKHYLTSLDQNNQTVQNLFQNLNIAYFGPIDGHDLPQLVSELRAQKQKSGVRLLHVRTTKGKGLKPAELNQVLYHAPGKFDYLTGKVYEKDESHLPLKFQDVFGTTVLALLEQHKDIIAITPAMPSGSGLKAVIDRFPENVIDVGIAEQHAVTLAAGFACEGVKVLCCIYSTFLQRAYDQLIHDVAIQNLPVVFCIDRAGLVGEDGATHHGIFDLAMLRTVPNVIVAAPKDEIDLQQLLFTAVHTSQPFAIRYPRARGFIPEWRAPLAFERMEIGKAKQVRHGKRIAVFSTGTIFHEVESAFQQLDNVPIAHVHFPFVKPLDRNAIESVAAQFEVIITVEDGVAAGGFGSAVLELLSELNFQGRTQIIGIPDVFIEHGSIPELRKLAGIDALTIAESIKKFSSNNG
ncbi:1-deoxy-D-xylulose-5-phosphate synthase [Flavobacterium aurantiibacter]|uniref:1-deoxy-D-xylulose-5-phosphate synthase n=1 Tax=Flavobacterium aurantiibacter TaxID=2023067 RepID=A0A255ZMJ1_9FLAO|nr:1-deoxy-D-xylulose-5-phosphate synthase [Flavobacterium aurantiibacter]OYQ42641.1 1-deoxy-D-xylulose-5-phosphate synthase [Flavobacterium aurantiibacter]